jgi:hypothetical protein
MVRQLFSILYLTLFYICLVNVRSILHQKRKRKKKKEAFFLLSSLSNLSFLEDTIIAQQFKKQNTHTLSKNELGFCLRT